MTITQARQSKNKYCKVIHPERMWNMRLGGVYIIKGHQELLHNERGKEKIKCSCCIVPAKHNQNECGVWMDIENLELLNDDYLP